MGKFLGGMTANKMATFGDPPVFGDGARTLAEAAYDHGFNPLRWHLGKPVDATSQQYYRVSGKYDPQSEYPGPDGILRLHSSVTREMPGITKLKLAANENRTFASMFEGFPDPARSRGVQILLDHSAPYGDRLPSTIAPANDIDTSNANELVVPQAAGIGCKQEWMQAIRLCIELPIKSPLRGGHRDTMNCARGFVSERCGGNLVDWG
jgi:hypothetical protein